MDANISEESIRPKIKKYLEGLGYPSDSILFEYATPHFTEIDAVVKINDQVLIACEIKSKVNPHSVNEIGYDPVARKLQRDVEDLKIKNYFISDGVNHIWLRTGNSGRPESTNPVKFDQFHVSKQKSSFLYEKLILVSDVVRTRPITGDFLYDLSILLYYRLLQERDGDFQQDIYKIDKILSNIYRLGNDLNPSSIKDVYINVQYVLESESLIRDYKTVFKFIDNAFQTRRVEWSVPRWLGDFMASVLDIKPNQTVLDLYSQSGLLTAAANLEGAHKTISLYNNDRDKYWILIHRLLTNKNDEDIRFEPSLPNAAFLSVPKATVDRVLVAPPFGIKFEPYYSHAFESGVNDSTAVLTEVAFNAINESGRVVVIVPESLLSSSHFERVRKYLKAKSRVEAIISLPNKAFHPYSSVKTSLLVLTKRKSDLRTFFASIEDTYDTNDKTIPANVVNQLLSNLASFRIAQNFPPSNLGFVTDDLDTESFQYSKYWFKQNYQNLASADGFTAVPLKDIAHKILRGSAITEDKKTGNIPFVSPGAVRKMVVAKESLSYTTKNKIPNNSVYAELDDIIINSIGNYRGAAALTGTEIVGLPINRHLFLVRPNKNVVLPGYLSVILNSDFVAEQLLDRSSGVIPSLNLKSFDGIYIPLPSMAQQEKIFEEFSQIVDAINQAENDLSSLNKSLNHKLNSLGKEASSR